MAWPGRRRAIIWSNAGILLIITRGTNFSETWKRNSYIFIQENPFENVVWKMAVNLSLPQCFNYSSVLHCRCFWIFFAKFNHILARSTWDKLMQIQTIFYMFMFGNTPMTLKHISRHQLRWYLHPNVSYYALSNSSVSMKNEYAISPKRSLLCLRNGYSVCLLRRKLLTKAIYRIHFLATYFQQAPHISPC